MHKLALLLCLLVPLVYLFFCTFTIEHFKQRKKKSARKKGRLRSGSTSASALLKQYTMMSALHNMSFRSVHPPPHQLHPLYTPPPPPPPPPPPQRPNSVAIILITRDQTGNIQYFLDWHRKKGVSRFYIRVEDKPQLVEYLNTQPDVTTEAGSVNDFQTQGELMWESLNVRYDTWARKAISFAHQEGIEWIVTIDDDELLDCEGLLQDHIQTKLKPEIQTVILNNKEAKYAQIPLEWQGCFHYAALEDCAPSDNKCAAYGNGKGMGRVSPDLEPFGMHRFVNHANDVEETLEGVHVLHFESCDFEKYKDKYKQLAAVTSQDEVFAFPFYNDSVHVARSSACINGPDEDCDELFKKVYSKYKLVQ